MAVTNQNCSHTDVKSRLNFGNACYYSVLNFFIVPYPVQTSDDKNIEIYNFTCCFIGLCNFISGIKEELD